ncbi:MAG: cadherin-like beta sandwich domain-containing protein [Clostridia bacterium]|nr:cadherin-like beta sandwich domain-containing protein [Clostridia bacterium]
MKNRRHLLTRLLPFLLSFALLTGALSVWAEENAPSTDIPETAPLTTPESEDEPIALSNTVFLTFPQVIRPGEKLEVTVSCDGEEIRAMQGSLTYNSELLTYVGSEASPEDWKITFSHEEGKLKYLGLSTENRGLSGPSALFTVTFQLNEGAVTDSQLPFALSDATAYDGSGEMILTGGESSFTVSRPLSTQCTLESLSIKGGNLSPAFSPDVTEYAVTLPYTALLAEISATACEYGKLKYSSRDLNVGENKITVTVISESGLQQVYTITVTRAADPNYVASTDNRILEMNLSDGLLFPAFSPEVTEYTLYMVQGYDVFLTPAAADKAVAEGLFIQAIPAPGSTEENSTAGTYTIVCYAEDGTPRTYTFETILLLTPQQLEEVRQQQTQESSNLLPIVIGVVAFLFIVIFFVGFVMGNVLKSKKKPVAATPVVPVAASEADPATDTAETPQETPTSPNKGKKGKKKKH